MNTRRQFLITAPLGVLVAAVACRGEQQSAVVSTPPPPTPGAPPTFGTAPVSGPAVSPATFADAAFASWVAESSAGQAAVEEEEESFAG